MKPFVFYKWLFLLPETKIYKSLVCLLLSTANLFIKGRLKKFIFKVTLILYFQSGAKL